MTGVCRNDRKKVKLFDLFVIKSWRKCYLHYSSISGDKQLYHFVSNKEFNACQFAQTMLCTFSLCILHPWLCGLKKGKTYVHVFEFWIYAIGKPCNRDCGEYFRKILACMELNEVRLHMLIGCGEDKTPIDFCFTRLKVKFRRVTL